MLVDPHNLIERRSFMASLYNSHPTVELTSIKATIVDRLKAKRLGKYNGVDASCWCDKSQYVRAIHTAWMLCIDNEQSGFIPGGNHPACKLYDSGGYDDVRCASWIELQLSLKNKIQSAVESFIEVCIELYDEEMDTHNGKESGLVDHINGSIMEAEEVVPFVESVRTKIETNEDVEHPEVIQSYQLSAVEELISPSDNPTKVSNETVVSICKEQEIIVDHSDHSEVLNVVRTMATSSQEALSDEVMTSETVKEQLNFEGLDINAVIPEEMLSIQRSEGELPMEESEVISEGMPGESFDDSSAKEEDKLDSEAKLEALPTVLKPQSELLFAHEVDEIEMETPNDSYHFETAVDIDNQFHDGSGNDKDDGEDVPEANKDKDVSATSQPTDVISKGMPGERLDEGSIEDKVDSETKVLKPQSKLLFADEVDEIEDVFEYEDGDGNMYMSGYGEGMEYEEEPQSPAYSERRSDPKEKPLVDSGADSETDESLFWRIPTGRKRTSSSPRVLTTPKKTRLMSPASDNELYNTDDEVEEISANANRANEIVWTEKQLNCLWTIFSESRRITSKEYHSEIIDKIRDATFSPDDM